MHNDHKEVRELLKQVTDLLRIYAWHNPDCVYPYNKAAGCNCGYMEEVSPMFERLREMGY